MTRQIRLAVKQLEPVVRRESQIVFARCKAVTSRGVVPDAPMQAMSLRLTLGWSRYVRPVASFNRQLKTFAI
jgi:hypothetical protein